jgi:hypothetical protein
VRRFWQLLAAVCEDPYRQQLYKIRSLGLTQSHQTLRTVAKLAPDVLDIALGCLQLYPPVAYQGRHRAVA